MGRFKAINLTSQYVSFTQKVSLPFEKKENGRKKKRLKNKIKNFEGESNKHRSNKVKAGRSGNILPQNTPNDFQRGWKSGRFFRKFQLISG